MYFLLLFPIIALFMPLDIFLGSIFMLAYILIAALTTLKLPKITLPKKLNVTYLVTSLLTTFPLGCVFLDNVVNAFPPENYGLGSYKLSLLITGVLTLYSAFSVYTFMSNFANRVKKANPIVESEFTRHQYKKSHIVIIAILSFITITIVSMNSPLYRFNNGYDCNAYMTVGRGIVNGLVPYKDLYDHKGPALYLIYACSAFISSSTYIGVYIFELIGTFCFWVLFYKTVYIYLKEKAIYIIPFAFFATYSVEAFFKGGTLEEFSLPLLMYAVYTSIRAAETKKIPGTKTGILIGITSGVIFWAKYTICGMYLGWIIVPLILAISGRKIREFLLLLASILSGFIVSTVPFIAYFAINGALRDLFKVYFYDNIFLYNVDINSTNWNLLSSLYDRFMDLFGGYTCIYYFSIIVFFVLIIGFIWSALKMDKLVWLNNVSIFIGSLFLFYGGHSYTYYSLIFIVFAVYGLVACYSLAVSGFHKLTDKKNPGKLPGVLTYISSFLVLGLMLLLSPNTNQIGASKDYYPQYKVAEIIASSGIENPKILNYGYLDAGFYFVTQSMPMTKYYYQPNFKSEEIENAHNTIVDNGEADFVLTELKPEELTSDFSKYNLIEVFSYTTEHAEREFLVFQKK